MQLRPAGNFKRWPKGREILCSKGNSHGKNEVSWHPRATGLIPQKSAPAQASPVAPHLLGRCSQSPLRSRLSVRSTLPHFTAGSGGGQGSPQEASRPGSPRVALLALAGAKLCEVCLHFLPARPFPLHALWPEIAQGLVWAGEIPLNSRSLKCKWPRYHYLLKISTILQKEDNI